MIILRAVPVVGAFFAASASYAAELPSPEPAGQYARVCDAFGAGFWYIPNSETCFDIGGYARADWHRVWGDSDVLLGGDPEEFNNWTTTARANVQIDARTASDLGLITTYLEFQLTVGADDFAADYSDTEPELVAAYIEVANDFAVFTAGHRGSFFDFYSSDDYGSRLDIDDNTTEQTLFAIGINGPEGLRGTLSVEDPASSGRRLSGADDHEGQESPDLVGSTRYEGERGSAQIMGVVRRNHDINGSGLGFAIGAGFTATLPIHDIGFSMQAAYADGALGYVTTDPGGLGDFGGPTADEFNQAWNVRAGFLAPVTDKLSAWLDGSFTHAEDEANDDSYDFWGFVIGAEYAANDSIAVGPEFVFNQIDGDDPGEDGEIFGLMWRVQSNF